MKRIYSVFIFSLFAFFASAQTTYTWNGSTSTAWNLAANWTPNTGTPTPTDHVVIVAAGNNPILNASSSITNITLTSGTLDLGGFVLTANGNGIFTAGTVTNGTLTIAGGAANTATLTNTTFNASANFNITTGAITINGGTFGGTVSFNQTGAVQTTGTGNATFNGTTTIENSGTNNFRTNKGMTFNGTTQLKVSNSGYLLLELTAPGNTYNGDVTMTITATGTGNLRSCFLGNTSFNGNILVENTGTGYIYFCESATATATLANGKTISVGGAGFSSGRLYLYRFTQTGATAQTITESGTAYLTIGPTSTFNGSLTATAATAVFTNSTFNGAFSVTKTGATNDQSGGNTFNSTSSFNNQGSGYLMMGITTADIYNGDVTTNNSGSERIILCYNTAGNQFNGNITVNQSGSATGTYIGYPGQIGAATLANGKTISAGTFNASLLDLEKFTQIGPTAQTITLTGTASLYIEGGSVFNASISATAPDIYARGATYNGAVTFTKTGGASDHNNGLQNIFNSTCTVNQQSNGGYFMLGFNSNDLFNDDITVTSTGTGGIYFGWNGGTGTPTLAAGKTILVGGAGFSSGFLALNTFTQLGNAAINLTFTGANTYLLFARSSVIGGNVTTTTPSIYFNGATFNGTVTSTKNGAANDAGSGGNTFQSTCIFTNTGAGYLMFGNGTADIWNADVTFTNTGSARFLPAYNSANNQFNGNITVNSTGSSVGTNFCSGSAAATAIQAATKTVIIGGSGFSAGYLILQRFTQLGNAAMNLTLSAGANYLQLGPSSTFGGVVTASAADVYPYGATYNSAVTFTKTGGTNNNNNSNLNVFNSTVTINQQSSSGYFMLGQNTAEVFNDDITVTSTGTGGIYLGWTTGTPTLAAGKTILVGGAGFSSGFLRLNGFTQLGNAAMPLTFTGANTYLMFSGASVIGGNVTSVTPSIYFNGATFNGTVDATKNGAANDQSSGGNTFQSTSIFTNTGAGYIMLGNGTADIWNADVTFTNTGSARILPAYNSANNQFNGNVTVNSTGSSVGINFCSGSAAATATMAATKTVIIGGSGYSAGYLILQRFTQLGNAAMNLTLTAGANYLQLGPSSTFGGAVTASAADVYPYGATYNSSVTFTKTGGTNNNNNSNLNIFNSTVTINQQSSSGYFMLGQNTAEIFNDDIIVTSTGTGGIYLGWTTGTPTLAAGKTIFVGGAGFSSGFLRLNKFTQLGNAAINLTFTGANTYLMFSGASVIGGNVTSVTPSVYFNGATFNGTVDATKNGAASDQGTGANTFNGVSTFTNTGAGYLMFGNGSPDIWNADVTFTNIGSERILPCWSSVANQFNGNIIVNSTGSSVGINFCGGAATSTGIIAAGKNVQIGGTGYTAGYLYLTRLTQLGNVATNLTMTGTSVLYIGIGSTWGGAFTASSPDIWAQGATYNGAATFTKTGGSNNHNNQNQNIFNSTVTVNQQSNTGYFMLGYNSNDLFNDDITVTSTGTGGIYFGWTGGTGTPTLAAGKTILVGGAGFSAGFLQLNTFTQLGNAAINLTFTGATTYLLFARSSVIGGNLTSSTPDIYFNGCTFNGTVNATKTGATNDQSSGNNIFTGVATMTNTGAGYLMFGNGNLDQFNAAATFNNQGSSYIYVAYNSVGNIFAGDVTFNNTPTLAASFISVNAFGAGTQFNGNIIVTSTAGSGVQFCTNTGAATLAAGKTITIGGGGFSSGTLLLRHFTQTGGTAQSLTLTGTGNITFGPTSTFNGNVTTVSPTLFFNGCTFNGTATSTKNGSTNDQSAGNNIFNGVTSMTCSGSGYLLFANGNADQFNTTSTFNNTGSSYIYVAYNSTGNVFGGDVTFNNTPTLAASYILVAQFGITTSFNGNIIVNSTSGSGVQFCQNTGDATLAAGKTITVGGSGFSSGTLLLRHFTQTGATAQSLTLTGTGILTFGPTSAIGGNITTVSPDLYYNGCTFNGTVTSTKNGANNNNSNGGNIFNGACVFTGSGTGQFLFANTTADDYNADVTFVKTNTGIVYPNYNTTCTYAGNISTVGSNAIVTFGVGGSGVMLIDGNTSQTLSAPLAFVPVATRLTMSTTGTLTLNTRLNISGTLTLTNGIINTTSTNILNMNNNTTTTIGNSGSYINGPMNFDMALNGTRTLFFPIGKASAWRPIELTAVHNAGTSYTYKAELTNASASALGWTLPGTVNLVSLVHYWDIDRTVTATGVASNANIVANHTIKIYYDANDGVTDPANLTICKNTSGAPTTWIDIGGTGAAVTTGSVSSTSVPTAFNSYSRFTLGNKNGGNNPLPIELLSFTASPLTASVQLDWTTATETNNDFFTIEKSKDGINFEFVSNVDSKAPGGNSTSILNYISADEIPFEGISYYRLKQTDFDGHFTYSNIAPVEFRSKGDWNFVIMPNPSNGNNTSISFSNVVGENEIALVITDASGKKVFASNVAISSSHTIQISLSPTLSAGVYLITASTAMHACTRRLIVE